MYTVNIPRLLIGAAGSGSGKTTFTCGLLQVLAEENKRPVSFKCGPDYIDPMFHRQALGIPAHNLDLFFTEEPIVRQIIAGAADRGEMAVIEGVMGYYDGIAGVSTKASSYHVAESTGTPAVLLADAKGRSLSVLAEIKGFLELKKNSGIQGVILNRISPALYPELKKRIEELLPVKVYGFLPVMKDCSLESRHLGLVTAEEVENLQSILKKLADTMRETVDVRGLVELAHTAEPLFYEPALATEKREGSVRIAVARDKAFSFYYEENFQLLQELGAELVFFSPLKDKMLPPEISGLILGGGYPELYPQQLSQNAEMRKQIREAVKEGLPCIAECGGFMYLHEQIRTRDGAVWPMAGVIQGESFPTDRLGRFGYITMTAKKDTLLCKKGEKLKGHEFHYWDSSCPGEVFHAQKPMSKKSWECVIGEGNLFAGYPHLYLYSAPEAAENFVNACRIFEERKVSYG